MAVVDWVARLLNKVPVGDILSPVMETNEGLKGAWRLRRSGAFNFHW